MWDELNVNLKSQRILPRYMRDAFGNIMMIPTSTKIKETEEETIDCTVYPNVSPVSNHIMIEEEYIFIGKKNTHSSFESFYFKQVYGI